MPPRGVGGRRALGAVLLVGLLVAVLGLAGGGIGQGVSGPPPPPGAPVEVVIPPGATGAQIAGILAEAGVVADPEAFVEGIAADGIAADLRPGTYVFRSNEEYNRLVDQLVAGPADSADTQVVIPEGYAIWDIRDEVAGVGITAEQFDAALAAHAPPAGFLADGEKAPSLEGFLFPATYDVGQPADADQLIAEQLAAFEANVATVDMSYAAARNLTPYDVLKIASLVERETADPAERRIVAGLIYNRLKAGMTLGIDSANQYANGSWRELTAADLEQDSPYNLRLEQGLPPTPIANPGLAAIKAAANPAKVDYLYMYAIKDDPRRRHFVTADSDE
ncbi:MAG: endolytic transglycosylase MltG, partial [Actinomycetota bacterium]